MSTILRARDLTPDELKQLLQEWSVPGGETARVWLEGTDGWALDYWASLDRPVRWNRAERPPEPIVVRELFPRVLSGRLFSPAGELRWRKLSLHEEASFRTVYLGSDLSCAALLEEQPDVLKGLTATPFEVPLWGRRTAATRGRQGEPSTWIELRVPHRFEYPVSVEGLSAGSIGVKALLESWQDARGEMHFCRLCDLQAYPGE